ncbi:hypothetical protein D3Y57_12005 [Sphingomonas paeninsulae]|uniref:Uncharacterized protein n=1 Tax=Sphingomonas paeninsulae TaxID=2319844 RepID=A0A494TL71_SPHPE|nr:hypothetical protein D3Y57_12005 [Sphingomonas paeninsulae]
MRGLHVDRGKGRGPGRELDQLVPAVVVLDRAVAGDTGVGTHDVEPLLAATSDMVRHPAEREVVASVTQLPGQLAAKRDDIRPANRGIRRRRG